jgi:hypothetical protein
MYIFGHFVKTVPFFITAVQYNPYELRNGPMSQKGSILERKISKGRGRVGDGIMAKWENN